MAQLQTDFSNPSTPTERKVAELGPWFQNLHLPDGTQTAPKHPLGDFPSFKWEQLASHLPEDLSGQRVLELGCNAGFYALKLAERGAQVDAVEIDPHYLKQAIWAAEQHGLQKRIRFREASVNTVIREPDRYDGIFFMGLFYHLRYPLLALDGLVRKMDGWMVFQTLTSPEGSEGCAVPDNLEFERRERLAEPGWPKMAFIEHRLADDPTNWWAANIPGVEAMLRSAGLEIVERPMHETYLCRPRSYALEGDAFIQQALAEVLDPPNA
ncbi:MAG: DUF1698 domain-containing protein [Verrucomicrobiota bacterium JB022]|nr:DUF1698 domain-containing protein [Verrucomicrobiota bacterium JB022]